jgi:hypothetical protein
VSCAEALEAKAVPSAAQSAARWKWRSQGPQRGLG